LSYYLLLLKTDIKHSAVSITSPISIPLLPASKKRLKDKVLYSIIRRFIRQGLTQIIILDCCSAVAKAMADKLRRNKQLSAIKEGSYAKDK
jgi:hypothetical protein